MFLGRLALDAQRANEISDRVAMLREEQPWVLILLITV